MRPKKKDKKYEKVPVGVFVNAVISDIEYEDEHQFNGKFPRVTEAVRFVFEIEKMEYPHRSHWMTFNYSERSSLYNKFIKLLVENTEPYMDFDLLRLRDLKVKMVWEDNGEFQSIQLIQPANGKIPRLENDAHEPTEKPNPESASQEEPVPF